MLCIKNNLGAKTDGLAYRIKTLIVSLNVVAPFLSWDSTPVHMTANEAMAAADEAARERSEAMRHAKEWLGELLEDGPVSAAEARRKPRRRALATAPLPAPESGSGSSPRRTAIKGRGRGGCRDRSKGCQLAAKGCHNMQTWHSLIPTPALLSFFLKSANYLAVAVQRLPSSPKDANFLLRRGHVAHPSSRFISAKYRSYVVQPRAVTKISLA
jgi:hypothetical protein